MSDNKKPTEAEIIDIAATELTYLPSPEQRKAKSAFWARWSENPLCEPQDISLALAARFTGSDRRLDRWWSQPGFREWFINQDEFRQRLEYLANLALDQAEEILAAPMEIKGIAGAKVNAMKLILEAARKMPSRREVDKYLDEKIASMNKTELEEFIRKQSRKLIASES